jgi:hypothetical protein
MKHHTGSIEVVTGSMFSGKTDELIRRLRRATIARQKVQVFKPVIDNRYHVAKVTSHAGTAYNAIPVENSAEIMRSLDPDTSVVGIDEAQFFDDGWWTWRKHSRIGGFGGSSQGWIQIFAASHLVACRRSLPSPNGWISFRLSAWFVESRPAVLRDLLMGSLPIIMIPS